MWGGSTVSSFIYGVHLGLNCNIFALESGAFDKMGWEKHILPSVPFESDHPRNLVDLPTVNRGPCSAFA